MPEPSPPPTAERRLAAILAADVVGYSRLMGEDEAGTVARLKAVRLTLIEPLVAEHRGRIVKLMGDGVLCEFASVVAAVACAVALQRAMAKAEPDEPEDRRIRFRIGINLGDIIIEDGDIYGDGVNIAARLEQLAEPGGICVSDKVRTEVGHKLDFGFADAGRQRVKNIAEPIGTWRVVIDGRAPPPRRAPPPPRLRRWRPAAIVAALLLALVATGSGGWWWWQREGRDEAAPFGDRISVVVLPFDNLSGDERLGRLADGMVVDIIEGLSVSRELAVIAPGTSFAYRDRTHDARQIGQELGVTYVVDGSLQGDGDRLRATVQLVDAATSTQVWAERYDRPLDDLFAVQEELTQRIASTLTGGVIARAAADAARRKPTKSLQAYDLLLLAQQERSRWTREGNARALELARQAIALEPRLAPAYVQLGLVYLQQLDLGLATSVDEALEGWLEAARKAVELDPTDARARVVLYKRYLYGGDFSRAVPELERALELAPGNAGILGDIAIDLPWLGQSERAVQLGERAKLLDPSTAHDGVLTAAYFFTGRFAEAAATVDAMEQPDRWSQLYAVLSYAQLDRAAELERWRARLRESWPDYSNERSVAETSDFAPAAAVERDLWVESHAKAGLPLCATAEQLAADPAMRRLPECDAERAKAGGS